MLTTLDLSIKFSLGLLQKDSKGTEDLYWRDSNFYSAFFDSTKVSISYRRASPNLNMIFSRSFSSSITKDSFKKVGLLRSSVDSMLATIGHDSRELVCSALVCVSFTFLQDTIYNLNCSLPIFLLSIFYWLK